MAAASPAPPPNLPSSSTTRNPRKFAGSISSSSFLSLKNKSLIRCELRHNSPNWTVDCVSVNDPIHIILKPPVNPIAMGSLDSSNARNFKRICLFYCAEMKALAERIAAESDSIELRSISWRTFEDGFPNLFISNAQGIRGQHVAFLASFSSPGVIFEQLSVIYALPKLFVSSFTLVLPFFPTGTSERMEDEGDVATAFTLARILSNIPISRGGPTSLVIFDIHALQERFYFGDNILPCFESGIPLLLNRLQELPDSDNISIAFPDDGAWKRFHKQLQHFPMIICAKVREGDQRIVRLKEGEPKGRHVVIVDDLVQSGGTLIECQKVLAKHGAAKISAYVTHGIFPNRSWERFEHDHGGNPENGMTYFWITDSCPQTVQAVKNKAPFEGSAAGSREQHQKEKSMAVNGIIEQWEVQYARFFVYPSLSSLSATQHPSVEPHSAIKRKQSSGVWISTSSSNFVSSAGSNASSATLKLISDCSGNSGGAILNVSLRGKVLEEHYISQLHFSWPQVSCVSGFPARGTRFVFLSFKDSLGQVQKFALRFGTVEETEKLVNLLQKILEDNPESEDLPHGEHISEISSHSEFVPSAGLSYRAEEGSKNTVSAGNCGKQMPATQNKDVAQLRITQEAISNSQIEERLSEYPPSFTSLLMSCYPAATQEQSKACEEANLRSLVARYLGDSSFLEIFNKVEKAINELGHNIVL